MEGLFNKKTKGIIINTPHNPLGKVFTMDELRFIADLAKKWDVLVISDEVYEWLVYEPYKHIRIGMCRLSFNYPHIPLIAVFKYKKLFFQQLYLICLIELSPSGQLEKLLV